MDNISIDCCVFAFNLKILDDGHCRKSHFDPEPHSTCN